ncbi:MAG: hypothetical protein ACJ04O_03175, partial [Cellvibrionales bacterium]
VAATDTHRMMGGVLFVMVARSLPAGERIFLFACGKLSSFHRRLAGAQENMQALQPRQSFQSPI